MCSSPATLSWARQMWSGRSHSPNMVFGRKYALHHGMIIIRSTWPMMTKDAVYDLGGISELSFPLIFITRKVLITWGIQGAPSRFSSLHFSPQWEYSRTFFELFIRSSSRTVAFSCSAPAEPCHRSHQVSLFLRCLYSYGLTIRPFARPFLDRCTEFSFF